MGIFSFLKKKPSVSITVDILPSQPQPTITEDSPSATHENQITPLEQRISNAYPSKTGLYPHEILMLSYAASYSLTSNHFQNFWKWEYSTTAPQLLLDSLCSRNYITKETPQQALERLTIPKLKELLVSINEKTTGKKAELISRILETYDINNLTAAIPDFHYSLTPLGKEEIKQNEYVLYLHRTHYVSVWEMNRMLHEDNPSHMRYRDIIWREFNKKLGEYFKRGDYGLYGHTLFTMHTFLIEEEKYKTALSLLLHSVSFSLSGLGNAEPTLNLNRQESRELCFSHRLHNLYTIDKMEVTIYPSAIQSGKQLYTKLAIPASDFIAFVYQECNSFHIHERVFSPDECANIFLSELGLEERHVLNSYALAQQRLKKHFKL